MNKIIALICILFFSNIYSQNIFDWKSYSSKRAVEDIVVTDSNIWAATTGGGFSFKFKDSTYQEFNKADGLNSFPVTAVSVDQNGNSWFGSNTGIIDNYDIVKKKFFSFYDIKNSDKPIKGINQISSYGDTILIATDFGVSLIDINKKIFIDTYFRFASLPSNINVFSAVKNNNLIFATTSYGVVVQKKANTNLSLPDSWNLYNSHNGLVADTVYQLDVFKGKTIAATSRGIFIYDTSFTSFSTLIAGQKIKYIAAAGDSIYFVVGNSVKLIYNNIISDVVDLYNINKIAFKKGLGLFVATNNGIYYNGAYYYPDGPLINQFADLSVDKNGGLWIATGNDVTGQGFTYFNGKKWFNYNTSTNPELGTNSYFVVYAKDLDYGLLGNWGYGFAVLKNNKFKIFNSHNSILKGIKEDINYVVISGFDKDSKGDIWALNFGAADMQTLYKITNDTVLTGYKVPEEGQFYYKHRNLAIDSYDTKWYSVADTKIGLFYFNDMGTTAAADDKSGFFNSNNGLNNSNINSVVADKLGDVWVGTGLGANIITNTYSVTGSTTQYKISSVFALRQQVVNCIAVDPINQKWVGTEQGLQLLNSDGTVLINSFTTENSPLTDNAIRKIAIDENNGIVYVSTDNSLVSFHTAFIKPQETFTSLTIFPNPFVFNKNKIITIKGLVKDSDIKILSTSGRLIKTFSSPGGNIAYWDGTDADGNNVPSGIYLINAYDKEGNSVITGKVAIIK